MNTFEAKTYSPIFAFDLVLLDVLHEVVVESGAKLKANDLIVQAVTNAVVNVTTVSTSILI